ncbi:hypothetical protein C8T65DRAFT_615505 [Cerioporus squamosus]|nr:hypothetical protein C8T65DRAFT_615505 [Cerioporus squamosus]
MHAVWPRIPGADVARTLRFRSSICSLKRCMSTSTEVSGYEIRLPRAYTPSPESRPVPLRTLFSGWLKAEDYVDLSDARGILVDPASGAPTGQSFDAPYITYGRTENKLEDKLLIKYFPFPVNTRGHLYYRRHPRFPIAGALRFRLTQTPDAMRDNAYARAPDLLTEYGTPWEIPLLALASNPRFTLAQDVLRRDGFLVDGALERCSEMCALAQDHARIGPFSQLIYEPKQPFYLNFAKENSGIVLVGEQDLISVPLGSLFPMKKPSERPFKSGIILCRFESYGPPLAAMRVLRVIEPVRMADGYDGPVGEPVVNELVQYNGRSMIFLHKREGQARGKYESWTHRNPNSKWGWLWNWQRYRKQAVRQGMHFPWDMGRSSVKRKSVSRT